jgi:hypothetical protein
MRANSVSSFIYQLTPIKSIIMIAIPPGVLEKVILMWFFCWIELACLNQRGQDLSIDISNMILFEINKGLKLLNDILSDLSLLIIIIKDR